MTMGHFRCGTRTVATPSTRDSRSLGDPLEGQQGRHRHEYVRSPAPGAGQSHQPPFEGSKVPSITYSSLKVTDATGKVLPARLGVSGTSVRIMFNDRHAVYPVRVDPLIQQSFLTPPAGSAVLRFGPRDVVERNDGPRWRPLRQPGHRVHLQWRIVVLGRGADAAGRAPSASARPWPCRRTGRSPWSVIRAVAGIGTATVYTLTSGVWSSGVALTAPAEAASFGTSVALSGSGTTALVGDPFGGDDGTGAATVYTHTTSWNSRHRLGRADQPDPGGVRDLGGIVEFRFDRTGG